MHETRREGRRRWHYFFQSLGAGAPTNLPLKTSDTTFAPVSNQINPQRTTMRSGGAVEFAWNERLCQLKWRPVINNPADRMGHKQCIELRINKTKGLNMKPDTFKNKVVVVTGATGGVGRATAWEFARQGARIALLARGPEQLEGTRREVEQLGGKAIAIAVDVADWQAVEAAAERIESELGPIDVWINNAMNSVFAPFKEIYPDEFKRVTEVTYLGQVYGAKAALNRMLLRNRGSIVFVGSALAYRGIPLQSAYCGAKHGIQGFYDSLRTELMHDKSKIKTSMVQLPAMNTTQFGWVLNRLPNKPKPMGKVYQPEVAAKAIVYAAAHNRREIYVGYPTYQAIYGNKIAAWFADWVLAKKGYKGQQTSEPVEPNRPHNVWEPVHEDRGAHGDFGNVAATNSSLLWLSINRNLVRTVVGLAAITLAAALGAKRKE